MERYVINLVYNQPSINAEGNIGLVTKATTMVYEKYKDAKKAYEDFNRTHILEYKTGAGSVTFFITSVEFVDRVRLDEYNAQKREEEENARNADAGSEDGDGNGEGAIEDADNENTDSPVESETEQ